MLPFVLRSRVIALALALSSATVACGGSAREGGGSVEYSVSAKQNYDKGMKSLEDEE